jgi:hypothetical protein
MCRPNTGHIGACPSLNHDENKRNDYRCNADKPFRRPGCVPGQLLHLSSSFCCAANFARTWSKASGPIRPFRSERQLVWRGAVGKLTLPVDPSRNGRGWTGRSAASRRPIALSSGRRTRSPGDCPTQGGSDDCGDRVGHASLCLYRRRRGSTTIGKGRFFDPSGGIWSRWRNPSHSDKRWMNLV